LDLSIPILFFYGVTSFLSPCFFPLFPTFLAYIVKGEKDAAASVKAASICAFGVVISFVVYGSLFWLLFAQLSQVGSLLRQIFGLVISLLGVALLTPLNKVFTAIRTPKKLAELEGLMGTFVLGFSYVLIAAPCAMPIFLAALFMTATSENIIYAIMGSVVFAFGAGVSLIASSFLVVTAKSYVQKAYREFAPWFERVSALLLIVTGLLLAFQVI
jgi:cytochrome c-type biogenesis protein